MARAITLVESTRADHRREAAALLDELLPHTGGSVRVGISGAPGVGKSTFIEAFGTRLAESDHRIAVLAVDPSSARTGGSILGDKTRMQQLAVLPNAYIRPSPSGGALGGVARRTGEALLVCEAAGFDTVLVETVGVGQAETEVDDIVDTFVLLVAPGGGDDLQGIKRGVMEIADLVVVTKSDGALAALAQHTASDYKHALQLLSRKHDEWDPTVIQCSALTGDGIDDVWNEVARHRATLADAGVLTERRAEQARRWLWNEISDTLLSSFRDDPVVAPLIADIERRVTDRSVSPATAALELLDARRASGQQGPK